MSFLFAFFMTIILHILAYVQIKTFQLCSYDVVKFLSKAIEFKFAFGDKNGLKLTKRMIRFFVALTLIFYFLNVIIFEFTYHWALILLDEVILILCTPVLITISHYLLTPVEYLIKKWVTFKASKKLRDLKCIKIAVVGSYGKASTKNILADILSKEYKVCVTKYCYESENIVAKTILNDLDDHDIFIADFDPKKKGEIEYITKLINPDYIIVTNVGGIKSNRTNSDIDSEVYKIISSMQAKGSVIINGDTLSGQRLFNNCKVSKFLTCNENGYAYAKDIKISNFGSIFTMVIDKKELHVKSHLLGKCNIDNIIIASTLAHILGISDIDIIGAVSSLEQTPHHLELILSSDMTVLDDSYNSDLIGSREALKVLSKFSGRKIVVTPGIVEFGEEQSSVNFRLGAEIADVADYVIIMSDTNKNYLLSGLISHNFNQNCVFFASTRAEQIDLLKKLTIIGTIILFENDI